MAQSRRAPPRKSRNSTTELLQAYQVVPNHSTLVNLTTMLRHLTGSIFLRSSLSTKGPGVAPPLSYSWRRKAGKYSKRLERTQLYTEHRGRGVVCVLATVLSRRGRSVPLLPSAWRTKRRRSTTKVKKRERERQASGESVLVVA